MCQKLFGKEKSSLEIKLLRIGLFLYFEVYTRLQIYLNIVEKLQKHAVLFVNTKINM